MNSPYDAKSFLGLGPGFTNLPRKALPKRAHLFPRGNGDKSSLKQFQATIGDDKRKIPRNRKNEMVKESTSVSHFTIMLEKAKTAADAPVARMPMNGVKH